MLGYKIVGDNLDVSVNTRYMRSVEHHNQSFHFFHNFAVLDRINFNKVPSCFPQNDLHLISNVAVLISHILVAYMPFFGFAFSDCAIWHLQHAFYKQMSTKSEVVSFFLQVNIYISFNAQPNFPFYPLGSSGYFIEK